MQIRVFLVYSSYTCLAKAVTIAIRYSCVRKQGFKDTKARNAVALGENTIMDYTMQQYRLFKGLALAYMFFWNARYIGDYLKRIQTSIMGGDVSAADELPELHATCAGLKVFSTVTAHLNIEDCRKACGGQGFMLSSGIAELSRAFPEPVTVEGEQVILSLQVARFLIKAVTAVKAGKQVAGSVAYLQDPPVGKISVHSFRNQEQLLLELLKDRTRRQAYQLEEAFSAAIKKGVGFDAALNSVAILAYKASEAHSAFVMARNNYRSIEDYVEDPSAVKVMKRLFELMALQTLREQAADWIDQLDARLMQLMLERINELLLELRPDAVSLVDSFGFMDEQLNSTLGRYDGKVYEAIYDIAKSCPLNQSDKMTGWDDLSKIFDLDFLREGMKTQHSRL